MLRSRTSRWARLLALAAAGLGLAAAPLAASAAPVTRVDICHYDADLGVYKLIKVAPGTAVDYHLKNHPDAKPGEWVPLKRGYTFDNTCAYVSHLVTINFDGDEFPLDVGGETGAIGSYHGFTWTKTYVYRPGNPDALGYGVSSAPNIGFIGYPNAQGDPLVAASNIGDIDFTSVFLTNPTAAGVDTGQQITVTINAYDDGSLVGTETVDLANGASSTVPLDFASVDTLKLSAGDQYFGIDDLTYFVSPN